jgi:hypothetical protein
VKTSKSKDEDIASFRSRLTPKSADLAPSGEITSLKEQLKDIPEFNALDEISVRAAAVELNRLMCISRDTPTPTQVRERLGRLADLFAAAAEDLDRLDGVSLGILTKAAQIFTPYRTTSPGARALSSRKEREARSLDMNFNAAFDKEVRALREIEQREEKNGLQAAGETNDVEQLETIKNYEAWQAEEARRLGGTSYVRWRGPPARTVLIDPLIARLAALSAVARDASATFDEAPPKKGQLPPLAIESWQISYAKICWTLIREKCGVAAAGKLNGGDDGVFLRFIRAMAEYASGETVEGNFGGAAKAVAAWGVRGIKLEKASDSYLNEGSAISKF